MLFFSYGPNIFIEFSKSLLILKNSFFSGLIIICKQVIGL